MYNLVLCYDIRKVFKSWSLFSTVLWSTFSFKSIFPLWNSTTFKPWLEKLFNHGHTNTMVWLSLLQPWTTMVIPFWPWLTMVFPLWFDCGAISHNMVVISHITLEPSSYHGYLDCNTSWKYHSHTDDINHIDHCCLMFPRVAHTYITSSLPS